MNTNTNLAYIAGYIDGDGCFYIGKTTNKKTHRTRYQAMIVITSTNNLILEHFSSIYGGSVRLSDNRIKHEGQKPQYQYIIKGKKAFILAKAIEPFMVEKARACSNFIDFINEKTDSMKDACIEWARRMKNLDIIFKDSKRYLNDIKNALQVNEIDYAYFAGFIDAECCLSISHYKPKNKPNRVYKIYLKCNNTQEPIFKWLMQKFGGQLHFVDRMSKNDNHLNQLQWTLSGKALSKILPSINQYLRYKKPVCEELMKFYATTLKNGGARHTDTFRDSYAEILKIREQIVHEVHRLNKKGI